jgi:hypothetical protein
MPKGVSALSARTLNNVQITFERAQTHDILKPLLFAPNLHRLQRHCHLLAPRLCRAGHPHCRCPHTHCHGLPSCSSYDVIKVSFYLLQ